MAWVSHEKEISPANPNSYDTLRVESQVNPPTVPNSTTILENDAEVVVSRMAIPRSLGAGLLSVADTGYAQGIMKFLSKPYRIRDGTWTSASPYQMHAISLPNELVTLPIYADKLDGYLAFRATIVLRLQVNANRFQQGRLIMSFVPQGQVARVFPAVRTQNLRLLTQLPNVQLDASCDTEAELRIPYVAPTTHFNMITKEGPHGAAYLHVYSPLKVGTGVNFAHYSIWAHFEDVELVTPTLGSDWYSQSGDYRPVGRTRKKRRDVADTELEKSGAGPVESIFKGIDSVATALTVVPLLSSVAGPVSWVSSALARTAAHFGWSNPMDESRIVRMKAAVFPYVNNSDAIDESYPMSLKVDNKVAVLPGFAGTDLDEMNLNFICSVPAFHQSINWVSTTPVGTLLQTWQMRPTDYQAISAGPSAQDIHMYCPMAFVSDIFDYYRGSIRITMKIVKTEFHSGRLLLAYAPGYTGTATPTIEDTNYLHREIIDVRECNEVTLVVPFVSTKTWLQKLESYGVVWLMVLNSLTAPDTVVNNVDILCEFSMDVDAEFAVPQPIDMAAYGTETQLVPFVSQSGGADYGENPDPCAITAPNQPIGNSVRNVLHADAAQYCVGEQVSSLLNLLKRTTALAMDEPVFTNAPRYTLRPFTIGGRKNGAGGYTTSIFCHDYFSIFAPIYAYNRGGVRLHVPAGEDLSTRRMFAFMYNGDEEDTLIINSSNAAYAANQQNGSCVPFDTYRDGGPSIQIPSYNRLHSRLNRVSYTTFSTVWCEPVDYLSSRVKAGFTFPVVEDAPPPRTYRQVSDDFAFGYFVGIPPMLITDLPRP